MNIINNYVNIVLIGQVMTLCVDLGGIVLNVITQIQTGFVIVAGVNRQKKKLALILDI